MGVIREKMIVWATRVGVGFTYLGVMLLVPVIVPGAAYMIPECVAGSVVCLFTGWLINKLTPPPSMYYDADGNPKDTGENP